MDPGVGSSSCWLRGYWIVMDFRTVAIFPSLFCAVIVMRFGPEFDSGEVKCLKEPLGATLNTGSLLTRTVAPG